MVCFWHAWDYLFWIVVNSIFLRYFQRTYSYTHVPVHLFSRLPPEPPSLTNLSLSDFSFFSFAFFRIIHFQISPFQICPFYFSSLQSCNFPDVSFILDLSFQTFTFHHFLFEIFITRIIPVHIFHFQIAGGSLLVVRLFVLYKV